MKAEKYVFTFYSKNKYAHKTVPKKNHEFQNQNSISLSFLF